MVRPNLELLARAHTSIGELVLHRRRPQAAPDEPFVELLVDGRTLMSGYNSVSERALAREALARCAGDSLRVLVGGLGLGHTAQEVLASPRVAALDVVEFVPEIIAWFEAGLMPLAGELRADARFRVIENDVYARLTSPAAERYDLLLIDVDHAPDDPLTADSASFYTADGLRRVCDHLTDRGVLAVWSCAPNGDFEATLREVFSVVDTVTTLFQDDLFGEDDETNWLFFASGPRPGAAASGAAPALGGDLRDA